MLATIATAVVFCFADPHATDEEPNRDKLILRPAIVTRSVGGEDGKANLSVFVEGHDDMHLLPPHERLPSTSVVLRQGAPFAAEPTAGAYITSSTAARYLSDRAAALEAARATPKGDG